MKAITNTDINTSQEAVLLRMYQIIGDTSRGISPIFPVGRTTWLNGVASGKYPKPIKHGRSSFWRKSDIHELLAKIAGGQ